MNIRHKYEGPEMEFARSVKAAVLGAIAVGILLIAAGTQGDAGIVAEDAAAQSAWASNTSTSRPISLPRGPARAARRGVLRGPEGRGE